MVVSASRNSVIVVERDVDLREMLGAALSRAGYQADLHPDALAALAAAVDRPPALYLFDVELPGMSGIEACRTVKRSASLRRPVLLTGAGFSATQAWYARDAGADALLSKPFTLTELRDAVARALSATAS